MLKVVLLLKVGYSVMVGRLEGRIVVEFGQCRSMYRKTHF